MIREDFTVTLGSVATIPYHSHWARVEISSDTVYHYLLDDKLISMIVRTPSIISMDTEVFLNLSLLTDRYFFLRTFKKEVVDWERIRVRPPIYLVYDRQEKAIFNYTVYNDDFSNKRRANIGSPLNHEIVTWQSLESYQVVEANEKGELKGRLKEIAAELDEEDNPVIMPVKHRR